MLPDSGAKGDGEAEAIGNEARGGHRCKAIESGSGEMDHEPAADDHHERAGGDRKQRPERPARCLESRRESQTETEERLGKADDNEILRPERMDFRG